MFTIKECACLLDISFFNQPLRHSFCICQHVNVSFLVISYDYIVLCAVKNLSNPSLGYFQHFFIDTILPFIDQNV